MSTVMRSVPLTLLRKIARMKPLNNIEHVTLLQDQYAVDPDNRPSLVACCTRQVFLCIRRRGRKKSILFKKNHLLRILSQFILRALKSISHKHEGIFSTLKIIQTRSVDTTFQKLSRSRFLQTVYILNFSL